MRVLAVIGATLVLVALVAAGGVLWVFAHFGTGLPDYQQLAGYDPPVMTRVHAGDGAMITEYATERRAFVPIEAIPTPVIKAFLSAEDKNFYSHPGVNFLSVVRAAVTNVINYAQNRRLVGASTITQQVAKNFLLTNELSFERKIREAILAFRIERAFTKDQILELYLNEIYLGSGSYGVAAAALNYFNKSLDELTVAEAAFLAALPKAPNNYHPTRNYGAAKGRRDWVIHRMHEDSLITSEEAAAARAEPLVAHPRERTLLTRAEHFAEDVRRILHQRYGENELYRGGLSVRTTLDSGLQSVADRVLRDGLISYDRRHGWRGAVTRIQGFDEGRAEDPSWWTERLGDVPVPMGLNGWMLAVVLDTGSQVAKIGFADGTTGTIPLRELTWAREALPGRGLGPSVKAVSQVLSRGDVVPVEALGGDAKEQYGLRQIPEVEGAIVALDPHTGRVLAMSGGYSFEQSQFNRATQAFRQTGSAFKPFVYLAALDSGFTPSSVILDAPVVIDQGPGLGLWKPHNYGRQYYGPSTMRLGLERSRNLMTVRLAQSVGMDKIVKTAQAFNIADDMLPTLSMALGARETTLLRLSAAYAMLVNGGKKIEPTLIDRIQDRRGRTVFRHDGRPCPGCEIGDEATIEDLMNAEMPDIPDDREQVADPRSAYQVVSMLEGVVQRGTGQRISTIGKPLAGKTGTTNESVDTWFIGFSPDLVVGVFVGFDKPVSLGRNETGSSVAAPMFKAFMEDALEDRPAIPFRIPPGIRHVRVNLDTGLLAKRGDRQVILEAFKPGSEPTGEEGVLDSSQPVSQQHPTSQPTRGLY